MALCVHTKDSICIVATRFIIVGVTDVEKDFQMFSHFHSMLLNYWMAQIIPVNPLSYSALEHHSNFSARKQLLFVMIMIVLVLF